MIIQSKVKINAVFTEPTDKKSYDAFLIIAGSGKVDHNGNAKNMPFNIYKHISDYLVNEGYATLRFDKRGVGESEGDFMSVGLFDLLEDIDSLVKYLKDKKEVNRVFLIGHSEGSILSSLYAMDHEVDGMIQIAGAGTCLKSALRYQNQVLLKEIKTLKGLKGFLLRLLLSEKKLNKSQNKIFDKVSKSDKDYIRVQLVKMNAKWMREHFSYTDLMILSFLKETTIKTLAVTGTKDVQANVTDLNAIKALKNEAVTVKAIDNMDHMLREYDGEKSLLNIKKQYKKELNLPLHNELLDTIGQFIKTL